jgi:hypothetical protein
MQVHGRKVHGRTDEMALLDASRRGGRTGNAPRMCGQTNTARKTLDFMFAFTEFQENITRAYVDHTHAHGRL